MNYTDRRFPWTCVIEHKWFQFGRDDSGNDLPHTIISKEYSVEWSPGQEPYYPINDETNTELYRRYAALAAHEEDTIFGGRLGRYRYYDMDQVIVSALDMAQEMGL